MDAVWTGTGREGQLSPGLAPLPPARHLPQELTLMEWST